LSSNKDWTLYVVECNDGSLYTGVTTDIHRRIREHNGNKKGSKYTRARQPVKLVYTEIHISRSHAQKRESEIKRMSRKKKIEMINEAS
tara:strand:+ start:77 stop:340 length:264 start_codon:yes stop_codon:yes gene_type:complete